MSCKRQDGDWLDVGHIITYSGHCALFHKWRTVHDTGVHEYQRCQRCGARRILKVFDGGYQPVHEWWRDVPIKYV